MAPEQRGQIVLDHLEEKKRRYLYDTHLKREKIRLAIIRKVAVYEPFEKIAEWATKKFGRSFKPSTISAYANSPDMQAILKKMREEFNNKLYEVEIASKRRRLEKLGEIISESEKEDGLNAKKVRVDCIRAAREEVEGKSSGGNINIFQYTQYNNLTDEDIDQRRLELIEEIKKRKSLTFDIDHKPEGAPNVMCDEGIQRD